MFAHSFSRVFCRSRWARAWWALLLCVLLLLTLPRIASAQALPKPMPQSIEQNLLSILQTCSQLRDALTKQSSLSLEQTALLQRAQKQLTDSANQIEILQGQLDSSQASVKDSRLELSGLKSLLAASQDSLKQLLMDFEALKTQRDKDVLQLQSERNKAEARASLTGTLAVIGYSALVIFAGYETGRALHFW